LSRSNTWRGGGGRKKLTERKSFDIKTKGEKRPERETRRPDGKGEKGREKSENVVLQLNGRKEGWQFNTRGHMLTNKVELEKGGKWVSGGKIVLFRRPG